VTQYSDALRVNPNRPEVHYNLGPLLLRSGAGRQRSMLTRPCCARNSGAPSFLNHSSSVVSFPERTS